MIRAMETIYDVFRMLVNAARNIVPDSNIEKALAIIDRHEADAKGGDGA